MPELKKTISMWQGLGLAVGLVVGSGLLGLPGISLQEGGIYGSAVGWVATTLAVVPLIHIFARLGFRFTSAAGLARYAQEAAGEAAAYPVTAVLCGSFAVGIPGLALIGAAYARELLGSDPSSITWLALLILGAMTIVNLFGVRLSSAVNVFSMVLLIGLVLFVVLTNLPFLGRGLQVLVTAVTEARVGYTQVWQVSVLLFWAFIGWENLSFGLEEFRHPERDIPRVYWLSFALVSMLYIALALTSIGAAASGLDVLGASGLTSLVGHTALGTALIVVMVVVIVANANAWVFGSSRLVFAAGRDGILPAYLRSLTERGIPWASLLSLFGVYLVVLAVSAQGYLSLSTIILLISSNFIILYLFTILAYLKTEKGRIRWLVVAAATLSCGFLLSGSSALIVYPLSLLLLGYLRYWMKVRGAGANQKQVG